jgi:SAM-dependent methyltransferase
MFTYIKYFFFLAWNWNFSIAWYIILQEIKGEKKYGIRTTGADELKRLEKMGIDISHATIYMPVSYELLRDILQQLKPGTYHHFLDIGCGKGRALCVAAHHGFKKLTGIDFSKELSDAAKENLARTGEKIPGISFSIVHNDAFYFDIPPDADCIFLFNPFDETIMSGVAENINKSLAENPRNINIIYANPLHKEYFTKVGFKETWYCKKMQYLEASILAV